MRRLTDGDLAQITGSTVQGYRVEDARVKRGGFTDSDHYGIILAANNKGHCVTWQFHLLDDDSVSVYWGHYFDDNREAVIRDFNIRDTDSDKKFAVTITETLKMTVDAEAESQREAEQMVSDKWKAGMYVLGPDNFIDVAFEAVSDS